MFTLCRVARRPAGVAAAAHSLLTLPPTSSPLTTPNMAASSDRIPPPFPSTEEPGAGLSDMADGDSDEGEDIFVSNVCLQHVLSVVAFM